jgi:hypothetical protein
LRARSAILPAVPHDEKSPTYGLPACLRIPVGAASVESISQFVGEIEDSIQNMKGATVALKVRAHTRGFPGQPIAKLWRTELGRRHADTLFPEFQIWVHVDYRRYREAYRRFGMAPIESETFLDHIHNRRMARLRWYAHPFLRLCPMSRTTNTNSGHASGSEGAGIDYTRSLLASPERSLALKAQVSSYQIEYADCSDLTKMLDISPGTEIMNGIRDSLHLFDP